MQALIGEWLLGLVPLLIGMVYGLENFKVDIFTEQFLAFVTGAAAILYFAGIWLYAPLGMFVWGFTSFGKYFTATVLYGLFGSVILVFIWQNIFAVAGKIAGCRQRSG